ncbi:MAG: hypothetical protein AAFN93_22875 [Bacteroidota bacterium]
MSEISPGSEFPNNISDSSGPSTIHGSGNIVSNNKSVNSETDDDSREYDAEAKNALRSARGVENSSTASVEFLELYFERVEYGLYEEAFQMLSAEYIDKLYLSKGFTFESAFADYKRFWNRCDIQYRNVYQERQLTNDEAIVIYQGRLFCSDDDQVGRDHSFKLRRMALIKSHIDGEWKIKDVTSAQ